MNAVTLGTVASFGRHILTYVMGAVSMAAAWHFISPQDAGTIGTSLTTMSRSTADFLGALAPLVAIGSGLWAAWQQTHKQQVNNVKMAVDTGAIKGVQVIGTPKGV